MSRKLTEKYAQYDKFGDFKHSWDRWICNGGVKTSIVWSILSASALGDIKTILFFCTVKFKMKNSLVVFLKQLKKWRQKMRW
jgi:hypothetical protein